jgi:hypothetical protein
MTTTAKFDVNEFDQLCDFITYALEWVKENAATYWEDVQYNANGERELGHPGEEVLGLIQCLETGNEDFWGLAETGYTMLTNDPELQWEVLRNYLLTHFDALLVAA